MDQTTLKLWQCSITYADETLASFEAADFDALHRGLVHYLHNSNGSRIQFIFVYLDEDE